MKLTARQQLLDWYFSLTLTERKRPWRPHDVAIILTIKPMQVIKAMLSLGWVSRGTFSARWDPPANPIACLNNEEEHRALLKILSNSSTSKSHQCESMTGF
jgi:hypothetical protein